MKNFNYIVLKLSLLFTILFSCNSYANIEFKKAKIDNVRILALGQMPFKYQALITGRPANSCAYLETSQKRENNKIYIEVKEKVLSDVVCVMAKDSFKLEIDISPELIKKGKNIVVVNGITTYFKKFY